MRGFGVSDCPVGRRSIYFLEYNSWYFLLDRGTGGVIELHSVCISEVRRSSGPLRSRIRSTRQNGSAFKRLILRLDGVRLHRRSSDRLLRLPCQTKNRSLSVRQSILSGTLTPQSYTQLTEKTFRRKSDLDRRISPDVSIQAHIMSGVRNARRCSVLGGRAGWWRVGAEARSLYRLNSYVAGGAISGRDRAGDQTIETVENSHSRVVQCAMREIANRIGSGEPRTYGERRSR